MCLTWKRSEDTDMGHCCGLPDPSHNNGAHLWSTPHGPETPTGGHMASLMDCSQHIPGGVTEHTGVGTDRSRYLRLCLPERGCCTHIILEKLGFKAIRSQATMIYCSAHCQCFFSLTRSRLQTSSVSWHCMLTL